MEQGISIGEAIAAISGQAMAAAAAAWDGKINIERRNDNEIYDRGGIQERKDIKETVNVETMGAGAEELQRPCGRNGMRLARSAARWSLEQEGW